MSQRVISVENLSKRYKLGVVGYGSLKSDLASYWARIRGKEDPNSQIGKESRLAQTGDFWALRNVGFEVGQGERLGIIGRNGAGKSTLFKILSRITAPTEGKIKFKGKITSLLEVGTGFHPELTGRENVYLNGAILGMRRREIQNLFDTIVGFSEIGDFIDTPVKRYSSGMYVRLAFSVAAHLTADIMIIDEVLAVGDSEFQKKCVSKMESLSINEGRTLLFVSHSMNAIRRLCNRVICLKNGQIISDGDVGTVVNDYLHLSGGYENYYNFEGVKERQVSDTFQFVDVNLHTKLSDSSAVFLTGGLFRLDIRVKSTKKVSIRLGVPIYDSTFAPISDLRNDVVGQKLEVSGESIITVELENLMLNTGEYYIGLFAASEGEILDWMPYAFKIYVSNEGNEKMFDRVYPVVFLPRMKITQI